MYEVGKVSVTSVCIHARMVSSWMKISAALANNTGASADIICRIRVSIHNIIQKDGQKRTMLNL